LPLMANTCPFFTASVQRSHAHCRGSITVWKAPAVGVVPSHAARPRDIFAMSSCGAFRCLNCDNNHWCSCRIDRRRHASCSSATEDSIRLDGRMAVSFLRVPGWLLKRDLSRRFDPILVLFATCVSPVQTTQSKLL